MIINYPTEIGYGRIIHHHYHQPKIKIKKTKQTNKVETPKTKTIKQKNESQHPMSQ